MTTTSNVFEIALENLKKAIKNEKQQADYDYGLLMSKPMPENMTIEEFYNENKDEKERLAKIVFDK